MFHNDFIAKHRLRHSREQALQKFVTRAFYRTLTLPVVLIHRQEQAIEKFDCSRNAEGPMARAAAVFRAKFVELG